MQSFSSVKFQVIACALLLLSLAGCQQPATELKEPVNALEEISPDTTGRKPIALLEQRIAERKAAGDTLIADAQKLLNVLTDSIQGYRLEVVEADTVVMPLSRMVEVRKVFYNPQGDYIELSIGDYVADPDYLRLSWQQHNLADSVPVSGVTDDRREVPGLLPAAYPASCTWSSFNPKDGSAQVHLIIDGRYFATVSRPLQKQMLDLNLVKSWLNWNSLK